MTNGEFTSLMNDYLADLKKRNPSSWSNDARIWAQARNFITGDGSGNYQYKDFATREQVAVLLYKLNDYLDNQSYDNSTLSPTEVRLINIHTQLASLQVTLNQTIEKLEELDDDDITTLLNAINSLEQQMADLESELNRIRGGLNS